MTHARARGHTATACASSMDDERAPPHSPARVLDHAEPDDRRSMLLRGAKVSDMPAFIGCRLVIYNSAQKDIEATPRARTAGLAARWNDWLMSQSDAPLLDHAGSCSRA